MPVESSKNLSGNSTKTYGKRELLSYLFFRLYSLGCSHHHRVPPRFDGRTRHDRTERRDSAFEKQMESLTDSYMNWSLNLATKSSPVEDASAGSITVNIIGLYSKQSGPTCV